jgi:hypothetical protein
LRLQRTNKEATGTAIKEKRFKAMEIPCHRAQSGVPGAWAMMAGWMKSGMATSAARATVWSAKA